MRQPTRRVLLAAAGGMSVAGGNAAAQPGAGGGNELVVNPRPLFDISRNLYMQFMEPLGATDSSVEAAWDYRINDWREDFVAATAGLGPQTMRWGGLFSRYYRWREGIGPVERRPHMRNYVWGGHESNRVGTHEFLAFCRRVGADPLVCVNFQSDGFITYRNKPEGDRSAGPSEAADWVSYCNDADHQERAANGARAAMPVKLWQLGNETSYGKGGFTLEEAIRATVSFSEAMKRRDASIQVIGWGDRGETPEGRNLWAGELVKRAGEHIDMVAMHMMGQSPTRPDTVLKGYEYQKDPARAWEELLELAARVDMRLKEMMHALSGQDSRHGLAVTEGHLSLQPHNANPILTEWLSAAYHARSLNTYLRHGARVRICTGADFAGNRWTVNAVMIQTPGGSSHLLPAGSIMKLYRATCGRQGAAVERAPAALDVAASVDGDKTVLHVLNTDYRSAVKAVLRVAGRRIVSGVVREIAPSEPRAYVDTQHPKTFEPVEKPLAAQAGEAVEWSFPARSVSAVILTTEKEDKA
ncbi:MAG: alpha-L-arabinofuranosidase [Bryobacterales bacterium]|nr:alpha-L-arabinofuranosidase [Bryobacterales bacterium]